MNRERLKYRKFLREMSWLLGAVGVVLVMFDWLVWRLVWPAGPWWIRTVGGAVGLLMMVGARKMIEHARMLGRGRRARSPEGATLP